MSTEHLYRFSGKLLTMLFTGLLQPGNIKRVAIVGNKTGLIQAKKGHCSFAVVENLEESMGSP